MLSAYLIRLVEHQSPALTDELVDDLLKNPRTPAFHRLSREELRQRVSTLYHGVCQWLADADESSFETTFVALGSQRFREKVPLSELIYALALTKQHLREKIRSVGNVYSALELHNEIQLNTMIGRFFDSMLYSVAKGYEHAQRESEKPATPSKNPLSSTPIKVEWVP